ncbi:MAG: type II toxin-antitoxin system HicB family antitoxin [Firmicutes bacterium]|nr:type II toxin-antitoxin system HicB family antitoxin [Bacillota bacterium]
MPKATYPIIFMQSDDLNTWTAFIPDLVIMAQGKTLEEAYAEAEETLKLYFKLSTKYDTEVQPPSPLEEVSKKWNEHKISLITANY